MICTDRVRLGEVLWLFGVVTGSLAAAAAFGAIVGIAIKALS